MDNLLNKLIEVPLLTIPRPESCIEEDRREGKKRDARLKASKKLFDDLYNYRERKHVNDLIKEIAGETQ